MDVKTSAVNKAIDPFVCPGNLLAIDRDPSGFDNKKEYEPSSEELLNLTRTNAQFLINEIWKLPRSTFEDATCADLPAPKYGLPREKPIPQKAPLTRWQRFAESKGIGNKNNRDKKVWDADSETWKPRYGYNRGNDNTKDWLIEIPSNKDPNVDYFSERDGAKKERIAKNQVQRMQNVKRQMNELNRSSNRDGYRPNQYNRKQSSGANSIPLGVSTDFKQRNKTELGYKMHHAKEATASAGKFQQNLKGEKTPKLGKKRKFEANERDSKSERSQQLAILEKLGAKKPKINQARINAAAEASHQSQRNDRRK